MQQSNSSVTFLRFNKDASLSFADLHMVHSSATFAIIIGHHMEPGCGSEEREQGGRLVPQQSSSTKAS